jgi:hypothetical protein
MFAVRRMLLLAYVQQCLGFLLGKEMLGKRLTRRKLIMNIASDFVFLNLERSQICSSTFTRASAAYERVMVPAVICGS